MYNSGVLGLNFKTLALGAIFAILFDVVYSDSVIIPSGQVYMPASAYTPPAVSAHVPLYTNIQPGIPQTIENLPPGYMITERDELGGRLGGSLDGHLGPIGVGARAAALAKLGNYKHRDRYGSTNILGGTIGAGLGGNIGPLDVGVSGKLTGSLGSSSSRRLVPQYYF